MYQPIEVGHCNPFIVIATVLLLYYYIIVLLFVKIIRADLCNCYDYYCKKKKKCSSLAWGYMRVNYFHLGGTNPIWNYNICFISGKIAFI